MNEIGRCSSDFTNLNWTAALTYLCGAFQIELSDPWSISFLHVFVYLLKWLLKSTADRFSVVTRFQVVGRGPPSSSRLWAPRVSSWACATFKNDFRTSSARYISRWVLKQFSGYDCDANRPLLPRHPQTPSKLCLGRQKERAWHQYGPPKACKHPRFAFRARFQYSMSRTKRYWLTNMHHSRKTTASLSVNRCNLPACLWSSCSKLRRWDDEMHTSVKFMFDSLCLQVLVRELLTWSSTSPLGAPCLRWSLWRTRPI